MNKFTLAIIAATALAPAAAAGQTSHSTSHSSSHSASSSSARSHSGVSWQHRGRGPGMHHRGGPIVRHHQGGGGHQRFVIHRRDGKMMGGGHHGINRHHRYKKIDRGYFVPHSWWGPQFQIRNWGMYGFSQPMQDRRWIRYFDDALLIDRSGRVLDGRWGMNWDGYSDRWSYNDQGVPYYEGDDYADEDYGYEDRGYADRRGPPPPPPMPCPQACGHQGYGYGYGYGWMPGGMITITETTVHAAAPQTVRETVYIEKKVKAKPRRVYRAKPRPQPGERG